MIRLNNWPIYRGNLWTYVVPVTDGNGNFVDLTAGTWSATFLVQQRPHEADGPDPVVAAVALGDPSVAAHEAVVTLSEALSGLLEQELVAFGSLICTEASTGRQLTNRYEIPVQEGG